VIYLAPGSQPWQLVTPLFLLRPTGSDSSTQLKQPWMPPTKSCKTKDKLNTAYNIADSRIAA